MPRLAAVGVRAPGEVAVPRLGTPLPGKDVSTGIRKERVPPRTASTPGTHGYREATPLARGPPLLRPTRPAGEAPPPPRAESPACAVRTGSEPSRPSVAGPRVRLPSDRLTV